MLACIGFSISDNKTAQIGVFHLLNTQTSSEIFWLTRNPGMSTRYPCLNQWSFASDALSIIKTV